MQKINKFKLGTLYLFLFFGFVCGIKNITHNSQGIFDYYASTLHRSTTFRKAIHTAYDQESNDYYAVLQRCRSIVPENQRIRFVLPTTPEKRFWHLREKGRYFLYPRNWGDNNIDSDYILVYQVQDFSTPRGFEKIIIFDTDKYLLKRAAEKPARQN